MFINKDYRVLPSQNCKGCKTCKKVIPFMILTGKFKGIIFRFTRLDIKEDHEGTSINFDFQTRDDTIGDLKQPSLELYNTLGEIICSLLDLPPYKNNPLYKLFKTIPTSWSSPFELDFDDPEIKQVMADFEAMKRPLG